MIELVCNVQQYDWGKIGPDSLVSQLSSYNKDFESKEEPYAELWMGTHPKGPSTIKTQKILLNEFIKNNQSVLGSKIINKFPNILTSGELPFLFKVLSINKALSIQAHPNKSHAELLHLNDPSHYPDNNHKPEMVIALTEFEGLCGFRPKSEIVYFCENIPELKEIITEKLLNDLKCDDKALKNCFEKLMTCKAEVVKQQINSYLQRLKTLDSKTRIYLLGDLFEQINKKFTYDVGLFCIYFLNFMKLAPGQAMFLRANLPHAYLKGDCIECMASSDNVVRAGLTPKFKDVSVLIEMLDYECKQAKDNIFMPTKKDDFCLNFSPNVDDFSVDKIMILKDKQYILEAIDSPSILLIIYGKGKTETFSIESGAVYFLPANERCLITAETNMEMFRAFTPV